MFLWVWKDTPNDATGFLGRRECHGLLLFSAVTCKVGDLGIFLIDKNCDRCPSSPYERSGTPQLPWQIGPPLGQVLICCLSGLSR